MTALPGVDEILAGGSPAAKFETIGTTYEGTIVGLESRQVTDFDSGEPKFYKDGRPQMMVVIDVQTDEQLRPDDDGQRRIYCQSGMLRAATAAIKNAGESFAVGGAIKVTYTGDDTPSRPGARGMKLFNVVYTPPVAAALLAQPQQPIHQAAQSVTPAAAPISQQEIDAMRNAGVSDDEINRILAQRQGQ